MDERDNSLRHLLPGIILIALGALFLADKFNLIQFTWIFRTWWPTLLIGLGVLQLINRPHRPVGGLILLTMGVIFQVSRLHLFDWWNMGRMWPVILIVIGVALLIARLNHGSFGTPPSSGPPNIGGSGPSNFSNQEVKS
jgi:cell wall-active antibiotic response 4TMS protein YvqF